MGGKRGETTAGSESMLRVLCGRTCTGDEEVGEAGAKKKKKGGEKQHVDIAMQMKSPSHETQRLGLNLQTGKDKDNCTHTHTHMDKCTLQYMRTFMQPGKTQASAFPSYLILRKTSGGLQ